MRGLVSLESEGQRGRREPESPLFKPQAREAGNSAQLSPSSLEAAEELDRFPPPQVLAGAGLAHSSQGWPFRTRIFTNKP